MMKIPVSQAKGRLTDLVSRAQAGEEVVLTRHGHPAVRLEPIRRKLSLEEKRAALTKILASAAAHRSPGPDAARSQDFLYDETGLPD